MKNSFLIYALLAFGALLIFANACKDNTTPRLASLETGTVYQFNNCFVGCGGGISDNGGSDVTARGVCWSENRKPTIDNDSTLDGSGSGSFVSQVKGLASKTTYYIRAYAINSTGIAYGNEIEHTTYSSGPRCRPDRNTITDSSQRKPLTFLIGDQTNSAPYIIKGSGNDGLEVEIRFAEAPVTSGYETVDWLDAIGCKKCNLRAVLRGKIFYSVRGDYVHVERHAENIYTIVFCDLACRVPNSGVSNFSIAGNLFIN